MHDFHGTDGPLRGATGATRARTAWLGLGGRPIASLSLCAALAACGSSGDEATPVGGAAPESGGTPSASTPGSGAAVEVDSGGVVLRRLNRAEYDNTVRDLLGTTLSPASSFPPDEVSVEGYDTIGLNLNFTPLLFEQADRAAAELAAELIARPVNDPVRSRLLPCEPAVDDADGCLQRIFTGFMRRAYRRPVTEAEVQEMLGLASEVRTAGGSAQEGLQAALHAVLLSPHFLFRVEIDPEPLASELHRVSDHELATRLSYFVWSSMPDDTLLEAADRGALTQSAGELTTQFERMFEDPKADRMLANFAGQWLGTRATEEVAPASDVFPEFDDALRVVMRAETERFFATLVREGLPLETLLLADFTFGNARLAEHYGIEGAAQGTEVTRLPLAGTNRIGLLTQTSFLSITSYPQRTSAVKRGGWVLEQLLCSPPPPPPPEVMAALEAPTPDENATLREKLEQHRTDPACKGCHALFDPIGLGLENFDAIGAYRTEDNGQPIDASSVLFGATPFNGAEELARLLAADPRFVPCVTEQLMTYAIGRTFRARDARGYVEELADAVKSSGGSWQDLLRTVVSSDAFSTRRSEAL